MGRHYEILYTPEDRAAGEPQRHLAEAAASGHAQYEGVRVRADGSRFTRTWSSALSSILMDASPASARWSATSPSAGPRSRRLPTGSTHDALTGLPNWALLLDRLEHSLARLQRHPARVGILFIDLDRFKTVNETLGHEAGDRLLVAVAERLLSSVRPEDTVARFGGDEFVLLCEDLASPTAAVEVARRIVTAFAVPVRLGWEDVGISASIGVASTADADRDVDSLLRDADAAMYHAKRAETGPLVRVQALDPGTRAERACRLTAEQQAQRDA